MQCDEITFENAFMRGREREITPIPAKLGWVMHQKPKHWDKWSIGRQTQGDNEWQRGFSPIWKSLLKYWSDESKSSSKKCESRKSIRVLIYRLKATLERVQRLTQSFTDGLLSVFPGRAQALGTALGIPDEQIQVGQLRSTSNCTHECSEA